MEAPKKVDYPTDDDSDDNGGFTIKVKSWGVICIGTGSG